MVLSPSTSKSRLQALSKQVRSDFREWTLIGNFISIGRVVYVSYKQRRLDSNICSYAVAKGG